MFLILINNGNYKKNILDELKINCVYFVFFVDMVLILDDIKYINWSNKILESYKFIFIEIFF